MLILGSKRKIKSNFLYQTIQSFIKGPYFTWFRYKHQCSTLKFCVHFQLKARLDRRRRSLEESEENAEADVTQNVTPNVTQNATSNGTKSAQVEPERSKTFDENLDKHHNIKPMRLDQP